MPMRFAVAATFFAPSAQATRANTVLTEAAVAACSVIMPCPAPSLLSTIHGFGFVGMAAGEDESMRM